MARQDSGQTAVPAHISQLMVELVKPSSTDIICDPFCIDAALLCAAARHVRTNTPEMSRNPELAGYFAHHMFHAFVPDTDASAASLKALRQCGVKAPGIRTGDALGSANAEERGAYSVVLTAIPDASCGDTQSIAKDLRRIAKTKRQALLGLVLVDAMLTPSARAAVLVPESVLSGNTNAHRVVHRRLIDDGKLQGIIRLPRVVVTAYPRQASLILLLGTESANDEVWAYDVTADGYSQDRRRRPLLSDNQLGPAPALALDAEAAARNELPDVVRQWHVWSRGEQLPAGARGTTIARSAIVAAGYRFDLDQLCRGVTDTGDQRKPHEVLAELTQLEAEIFEGLRDIVAALK